MVWTPWWLWTSWHRKVWPFTWWVVNPTSAQASISIWPWRISLGANMCPWRTPVYSRRSVLSCHVLMSVWFARKRNQDLGLLGFFVECFIRETKIRRIMHVLKVEFKYTGSMLPISLKTASYWWINPRFSFIEQTELSLVNDQIDGLVQDRSIAIANALEILQSSTKLSKFCVAIDWVLGHSKVTLQQTMLIVHMSWWRHEMETLATLLPLCDGKTPVTDGFGT